MKKLLLTLAACLAVLGPQGSGIILAQSNQAAVFVANNAGDSITSYTVNSNGVVNFVGTIPTGESPQCISISTDGRFIAVGHGTVSSTTEQLRIFEVNSDASLTQRLIALTPDSPLDCQWVSDTVLAVSKTDLSDDNYVIMYEWNDLNNSLTQVDMAFTGTFHTSLAVSLERSLLFANNSLGTDSIYSFTFDTSGQLTQNDNEITDPIFPLGIACSNDGNFVYGAGGISGSGNEILAFSVDANGELNSIAGAQSPGSSPKVIDLTDDGNILVAGHGTDSTIQSFTRDPQTGLISHNGFSYDVGSQGNLGDLQIMGRLMFVTDESTSDDGVRGLLSFTINNDGSFTQNGSIVDSQGARPEYIATWPGQGPVVITADSFQITRGTQFSGGLSELQDSDNTDLGIQRSNSDLNSITEFEIKATSPSQTPTQFEFTLEGSVFARTTVVQSIWLFDYDADQFELVDTRNASRFSDQTTTIVPNGDFSRFIQPGTSCIESRIRYSSPSQRQQFSSNIDLVSWLIAGPGD